MMIKKIERKFPQLTAQDVDVFIAEKWSYILIGDKLSTVIVMVTVIAVIFGLSNIMLTSFFERRKLIGLLIAMGWQKSDVLRNLVCQSLLISFAGGVLGIPLGFFGIEHLFGMVEISLFMPVWNMALLAKIIGIIIASGIVAALIPSSIILNLNPVEVIKSE
jgi:ABC-type antimicrobial peptide transport system permease subunit